MAGTHAASRGGGGVSASAFQRILGISMILGKRLGEDILGTPIQLGLKR